MAGGVARGLRASALERGRNAFVTDNTGAEDR